MNGSDGLGCADTPANRVLDELVPVQRTGNSLRKLSLYRKIRSDGLDCTDTPANRVLDEWVPVDWDDR